MQTTYAPVLMILDDDKPLLKGLSNITLDSTALGVLEASNLDQAAKYIEDPNLRIDAVLADINFVDREQSEKRDLHNGLDLLAIAKRVRPTTLAYVNSVEAEDEGRKKFAGAKELNIRSWFNKLGNTTPRDRPWLVIERDLWRNALKSDAGLRQSASENALNVVDALNDEALPDLIRQALKIPRRTYLQRFPSKIPYIFTQPVEAICFEDQAGRFRAMAVGLGLLETAEGADVTSALEALAHLIAEQYEQFQDENPKMLVGYAQFVARRLQKSIKSTKS